MKKICFIFGGSSPEHEISVTSLRSVLSGYQTKKYEICVGGFDRDNNLEFFSVEDFFEKFPPYTPFESSLNPVSLDRLKDFDLIFPVVHGSFMEDGCLQGLLQFMNVPFMGPDALSSAICMDKEISKRLLMQAGFNVADWIVLESYEEVDKTRVEFPCFVKPSASGSSCGVSKVKSVDELVRAIQLARTFSKKVLIEKVIEGMEFECAVLGMREDLFVSKPGRVIPLNAFFDAETKFVAHDRAQEEVVANIEPKLAIEIQEVASKVFLLLQCEMMARIDFFYDGDKIYVNEANTIPGLTPFSLYPKMLLASEISYEQMIDRLIEMGLSRHHRKSLAIHHSPNFQCPL